MDKRFLNTRLIVENARQIARFVFQRQDCFCGARQTTYHLIWANPNDVMNKTNSKCIIR